MSQLANQKPCLWSWYPVISSHWPNMVKISCWLGQIWVWSIPIQYITFWYVPGTYQACLVLLGSILAQLCLAKIFILTCLICCQSVPKDERLGISIKQQHRQAFWPSPIYNFVIIDQCWKMHSYHNVSCSKLRKKVEHPPPTNFIQ